MARKKPNKRNLIITSSIFLILIIVIVGVTFAYFVADITGNDTAKKTQINSGTLELTFETSEYISNSYGELINDSQKETLADHTNFTIKHTAKSNVTAKYNLELTDIDISQNLKSPDFKWELSIDGKTVKSGNFGSIGSSTTISIAEAQTLAPTKTANCVFRVWLSETSSDQSSLYEGTFKGKISLVAESLAN